jgi:two-component system, cell cycle sensor histidine kinase and response regulator CckA
MNDPKIFEQEPIRTILRSISDGVIAVDANARVTHLNETAEQMTGWSCQDAVGKPLEEIFQVFDAHSDIPSPNSVTLAMTGGLAMPFSNGRYLVGRNGDKCLISESATPVRMNQDGSIIGVVLVIRDLTRERRRQEEVQKAQRLEALGSLAGGIAHDFNNILTGVFGFIGLAQLEADPGTKIQQRLAQAEKALARARQLSSQLLTFSRGHTPNKKVMSVLALIQDESQAAIRGTTATLRFEIAENIAPVDADESQLVQVIRNLVLNAAQAMPEGGMITIRAVNRQVRAREIPTLPPGEYVCLSVCDQGPGIPLNLRSRIFEPYFSTKKQGAGLGLSVAYAIIRNHHGLLTLTPESEGQGATFQIFLPVSPPLSQSRQTPRQRPHLGRHARILVMDDDEIVREVVVEMLERLGYDVTTVPEGNEAVRVYKEAMGKGASFDAVILDLTIPGGRGGKETLVDLLAINPQVKAFIASGYIYGPLMTDYRSHGFIGAIAKPFDVKMLIEALASVIPPPERS